MNFIVRNYKPHQYELVRDWANSQSWNQGTYDHLAFRLLDKNTFWIGELDGVPIASLSAAQYDENFGFLGLYIVKPLYRGKGYGLQVWKRAIQSISVKNISLQGVLQQEKNYQKSGFKTYHNTTRYSTNGNNQKYPSNFLIDCKNIDFNKLCEFDRKNFPAQRKEFLNQWINLPQSKSIAFMENDQIEGYGVLRASANGYRIGPLFANSFDVAEHIFSHLIGLVSQDKKIAIDVPEVNKEALKLIQKHQMKPQFQCARMYTNGEPEEIRFDKTIYGITSLQFG